MSIENNILANSIANDSAQSAYEQSINMVDSINSQTAFDAKLPPAPIEEIKKLEKVAFGESSESIGKTILEKVAKISNSNKQALDDLKDITQSLNGTNTFTSAELMKLQMGVMKWQIQQEAISKATNSISNGIQTMMRNQ